ncbi:MAG TPA: cytochrome c oxidase assembly protein [Gaiellaceae bacterium]|nr:cytochrome c oxidase assembly protein [Gaiellaceae bacterium]
MLGPIGATPSAGSWSPAWEELAFLLLVAVGYGWTRAHRVSRLRSAAFALGLALAFFAVASPVATVALHYLLSAHLLQNVVLAEWTPALLVLGLPPAAAASLAARPAVGALTRPVVALPLWLLTYAVWHLPVAYEAALEHRLLLDLEHLSYVLVGVLLWWPVFQDEPWRLPAGGRAAYLFAAFVLASPLGLLLALLPSPIYDTYVAAPRLWGIDPLEDQQLGGTLMAVSEAVVFFSLLAVYFVRFMAEEDAGYSHGDA